MSHRVLSWKQLPARLPITSTIVWYLFLDHLHAPSWIWGVMGGWFVLVWAVAINLAIEQEPVEIRELNNSVLQRARSDPQ